MGFPKEIGKLYYGGYWFEVAKSSDPAVAPLLKGEVGEFSTLDGETTFDLIFRQVKYSWMPGDRQSVNVWVRTSEDEDLSDSEGRGDFYHYHDATGKRVACKGA